MAEVEGLLVDDESVVQGAHANNGGMSCCGFVEIVENLSDNF